VRGTGDVALTAGTGDVVSTPATGAVSLPAGSVSLAEGAGAGAVSGTLANALVDLTPKPGNTRLTGTSRGGYPTV